MRSEPRLERSDVRTKASEHVNYTQVTRRSVLGAALAGAVAGGIAAADQATSPVPPFDLGEATVADLQAAMAVGRITSKTITAKYLERIDALDRRGPRDSKLRRLGFARRDLRSRGNKQSIQGMIRLRTV